MTQHKFFASSSWKKFQNLNFCWASHIFRKKIKTIREWARFCVNCYNEGAFSLFPQPISYSRQVISWGISQSVLSRGEQKKKRERRKSEQKEFLSTFFLPHIFLLCCLCQIKTQRALKASENKKRGDDIIICTWYTLKASERRRERKKNLEITFLFQSLHIYFSFSLFFLENCSGIQYYFQSFFCHPFLSRPDH